MFYSSLDLLKYKSFITFIFYIFYNKKYRTIPDDE